MAWVLTASTGTTVAPPGASVTVYVRNTSTKASIASDSAGTAKPNPFTADILGAWAFYHLDTVKVYWVFGQAAAPTPGGGASGGLSPMVNGASPMELMDNGADEPLLIEVD